MATPFQTLIASGTKLWLDSIDPDLVQEAFEQGVSGATSNPMIVADLIKTGRFDELLAALMDKGLDDPAIAWAMTDHMVSAAQKVFAPIWERTQGNDGYVSFELDPLLEDPALGPPHAQRVARYIELGRQWSQGHSNRMIKVPATPAGLEALETLAAAGVTLNVTLIFTSRQYRAARDAVWRGARQRTHLEKFKSVYSIFVSRVDVYTDKHVPQLSAAAQGRVGIVNAKRVWTDNEAYWSQDDRADLELEQEIVFASTGVKKKQDPADLYVQALAGSGIMTNPPATNAWVQASGKSYTRQVDRMPDAAVLAEIDRVVDMVALEETLLAEGVRKFADPQRALLNLIAQKRSTLAAAR